MEDIFYDVIVIGAGKNLGIPLLCNSHPADHIL